VRIKDPVPTLWASRIWAKVRREYDGNVFEGEGLLIRIADDGSLGASWNAQVPIGGQSWFDDGDIVTWRPYSDGVE
jgi:hypothetical protein